MNKYSPITIPLTPIQCKHGGHLIHFPMFDTAQVGDKNVCFYCHVMFADITGISYIGERTHFVVANDISLLKPDRNKYWKSFTSNEKEIELK